MPSQFGEDIPALHKNEKNMLIDVELSQLSSGLRPGFEINKSAFDVSVVAGTSLS